MRNNLHPSDKPRRVPKPLDEERLRDLAVHYVGRYATTRAKLTRYLGRKLRERGWDGEGSPEIEALVAHFDALGYVDDQAFAEAKSRALTARGYGARRVGHALYAAGIEEPDRADAEAQARDAAFESAGKFARKRRVGPFAVAEADPDMRRKQLAAFLRAGHDFALARAFVDAAPGEIPEKEDH